MSRDLVLELPSDVQSIASAVDFVMARFGEHTVQARRVQFNFRVGLTEALSNAMLYGNGHDPAKRVVRNSLSQDIEGLHEWHAGL